MHGKCGKSSNQILIFRRTPPPCQLNILIFKSPDLMKRKNTHELPRDFLNHANFLIIVNYAKILTIVHIFFLIFWFHLSETMEFLFCS
jgi:hypothetical protein